MSHSLCGKMELTRTAAFTALVLNPYNGNAHLKRGHKMSVMVDEILQV